MVFFRTARSRRPYGQRGPQAAVRGHTVAMSPHAQRKGAGSLRGLPSKAATGVSADRVGELAGLAGALDGAVHCRGVVNDIDPR